MGEYEFSETINNTNLVLIALCSIPFIINTWYEFCVCTVLHNNWVEPVRKVNGEHAKKNEEHLNGSYTNGEHLNGSYVNGHLNGSTNGFHVNGTYTNGKNNNGYINGVHLNGAYTNGKHTNGYTIGNGLHLNGVYINGVY